VTTTGERCPQCGGPMPEPKPTGRPAKVCSGRCRRTAERQRRAEERLEAERLAHRQYLIQLAAERQRAAVELVALITQDPQGAVSAIDQGCRSFATHELERLRHEIASGGRSAALARRPA
jgi:hypothetical protein